MEIANSEEGKLKRIKRTLTCAFKRWHTFITIQYNICIVRSNVINFLEIYSFEFFFITKKTDDLRINR